VVALHRDQLIKVVGDRRARPQPVGQNLDRFADNKRSPTMKSLAPVEYVLIGFDGNNFSGGIAKEIANLVDTNTVRILDLVFVMKDADGTITSIEYDESDDFADYASIDGDADGFLDVEFILAAADELDPNTAALLVVWEDLWAARLSQEIIAAGGQMISGGRIPHQVVTELLTEIEGK